MNNDARQWISNFVNNPFLKQQQALVIEGPAASGKSVFCELLMKVTRFQHPNAKRTYLHIGDYFGSFGGVNLLVDNNLAIVDEPNDKTLESLKPFMALQTFERNRQLQDPDTVTIQTNFIITTNDASRMNSEGSRRFIIVNPITAFALLSSI